MNNNAQIGSPSTSAVPTEVEAALAICAANPLAVIQELAALERLGDYLLVPRPDKHVRDIYLDTPERTLSTKLFSLRLRDEDGVLKLTLKGGQAEGETGLKVRRELERNWDDGAWAAVRAELVHHGLYLPEPDSEQAAPLTTLLASGLIIIQDRSTYRIVRDVACISAIGETPVAELAIDAVSFRFPQQVIRHYEVEIEAKLQGSAETVRDLAKILQALFPGQLQPWPLAKLALGMRLQALLERGQLAGLIAPDGTLLPEAYPVIATAFI